MKAKYDAFTLTYRQAKIDYDAQAAVFKQEQDAYNARVQALNERGGASRKEYAEIQAEKASLHAELTGLREREAKLHDDVDEINALVVVLNRLVVALNLNVAQYNAVGVARGEEFTEGDYEDVGGVRQINIYEFSTRDKLVRVLAHEFGHALGLDHVADSKAIMYKLNTSTNEKLAPSDLAELQAHCGIR